MPNTYVALATQTLGTAASSVTFSSISASYTDLIIVFDGTMASHTRIDITVGNGTLDTGANYSNTELLGNGTTASSLRNSSTSSMQGMFDSLGTGTGQINSITSFQNYANTTTYKTVLGRSNSASNGVTAYVGLWRSTVAITTIRITGLANFNTGSTFSLYGILAA